MALLETLKLPDNFKGVGGAGVRVDGDLLPIPILGEKRTSSAT